MKNQHLLPFLYKNVAERFPFAPRIRRCFWGLLMFCVLAILIDTTGEAGIRIGVTRIEPLSAPATPIATYPTASIVPGQLLISNPTMIQRLLLHESFSGLDLFTLIMISIASIIMIVMTPKLNNADLFRKDVSGLIRVLGYLVIFHGLVGIYRNVYEAETVQLITNNTFGAVHNFPVLLWAELYFGFVVIAIATWYRKGVKLQQEQDLTV